MHDAHGLEMRGDASAVAAVDRFGAQLLAFGPDTDRVCADADAHPDCPLLQAHAAAWLLYGLTHAANPRVGVRLERAYAALDGATSRERQVVEALDAWAAGDLETAMERLEAVTAAWPQDATTAKLCEYLYFMTGQAWNAGRFLAHMERIAPWHERSSGVIAMRAFALELVGRLDDARAAAERAVALDREMPWAHHCLAHVYLRTGGVDEGERVLAGFADTWARAGRAIHGHNGWHLALFSLERLDFDAVARLEREHVATGTPDGVGEQIDVIALRWRVELAGGTAPWDDLVPHVAPLVEDVVIPFASAHHAWALARAGERALVDALVAACRARAAGGPAARRRVWTETGLPLVEGCAALAAGDALRAAVLLQPIAERVGCVGGRDAQDDVFLQTWLAALTRSRRHVEARRVLARMRPGATAATPLAERWRAAIG